ncbi:hydroxymethylbilane synthase [Pullulanibacillus sp. KACC 23026]|uniref:hydroxymethylbilane synthase n=1 Tax=Pullulanibacillus sp. KACC 23026 TaxID=3028315 RepID=UPI0023B00F61|nr:hydroxymethylbilane synthase [Pullulanibacillus sp. KACC 23026]WEG14038.1 hydroxymethylbilane synthase [Pullulanibacillus sp. KACC 23026]
MRTIRVGSRKSQLALTQTNWVMDQLKAKHSDLNFELKHIVTKGDKILDVTLSKVGGKGLFVKEIEQALYDKEIDFAVHSMKDMPAELPPGLTIACIPVRENPFDVIITKDNRSLAELPEGAVVGTSSLRRQSQLLAIRPDLEIESIRGNIDSRLRKLEEGPFDAIVLAAAGLERMGWSDRVKKEVLEAETMLPAVGQGALAIECRSDDEELLALLKSIHDEETAQAVQAERGFLGALEGGCQVPIAAFAQLQSSGTIQLSGLVATPDGQTVIAGQAEGSDPLALGEGLANDLKERGAKAILDSVKEELNQ